MTTERLCRCTADTELGAASGCAVCGHRDHGKSGCRAPIWSDPQSDSQPPTSEPERETAWMRDDCQCRVTNPDGDRCALAADYRNGLCSHCQGHAASQEAADRTPPPGAPPSDDDLAVWSHSRADWLTPAEARAALGTQQPNPDPLTVVGREP